MSSARTLWVMLALAFAGTHPAVGASADLSTSTQKTPSGIVPGTGAGRANGNWNQFRFNSGHTGFNPLEHTLNVDNVSFLSLGFEAELGDPVFSSSPAVVGDVAYIASRDGTLWAFPADGCRDSICSKPLWKSAPLGQIIDSPTVANGIVYIGSQTSPDNNDGKLSAFAAGGCGKEVCAPLWQGEAGKDAILESSPTVADGLVYIGAFDGRLYAFPANGCDALVCQPAWIGSTGGSIESTPTVSDGIVYIGSDDGFLYAFKGSGCNQPRCQPLWRGELAGPEAGQLRLRLDTCRGQRRRLHRLGAFARRVRRKRVAEPADICKPLWQAVDESAVLRRLSGGCERKRLYRPRVQPGGLFGGRLRQSRCAVRCGC